MVSIYSWNVNGIRAIHKKGAWESFLDRKNPDILCLQEIKAKPEQIEIPLDAYEPHWNPAVRPGYSGTAILSKHSPLRVLHGFPDEILDQYGMHHDTYGNPNFEGRVLAAEYADFWVVTVYVPNAKSDLSRLDLRHNHWDPAFLQYCQLLEKTKPVIFCGDLNVAHTENDLANPKANQHNKGFTKEERAGFQAFVDAGFVDTLRLFENGNGHYTWWSYLGNARARNVGWRIDYVLVSDVLKDHVKEAKIHADIFGSDHCPVSITLDL